MSTLSKTPDDKMHRYLQRIQKLVGHRAKSPILVKSRNKSPMNVKASRVSQLSKHQPFLKSIVSVCTKYHRDNMSHFLFNFLEVSRVNQAKRKDSHYSEQNYRKTAKKQNDQPLAVRFMVKALQKSILRILSPLFESIKAYEANKSHLEPQQVTRDIKKALKHRRTYSQIYAQSLSKYQSKSPATSQRYEFKTPSVAKKDNSVNSKKVQAILIGTVLQKIFQRSRLNTFSQIKSFFCTSLSLDINQARHYLSQIEQKFTSLKKQQQKTVQQLKSANQTIVEQQKTNEMTFFSLQRIKEQSISKNQDDPLVDASQIQRILHHTTAVLSISKIFNRKIIGYFTTAIERIKTNQVKKNIPNQYAKFLALSSALKSLWNSRRKLFITNLVHYTQEAKFNQKSQKSLFKTESRQIITERAVTPTHITQPVPRLQSMQSSKHSQGSQRSNASNFDIIAKKINSAFELKATLRQIYAFGFQKIDQAAFMYMTISSPISKLVQITSRESFRKILFYSFFKSQSENKPEPNIKSSTEIKPLTDNKLMTENKPPIDRKPSVLKNLTANSESKPVSKNYEKMSNIMKKVQKKIIFMKIEAYRQFILKLNSELKQPIKIPEDVVISQVDLKKEIREFLNQRNKMHQKTYDTWHKTKQMLQQATNTSSRSSLNTRIKA